MTANVEIMEKREKEIVEAIKELGPITAKDISEIVGIGPSNVRLIIRAKLMPKYPEIKSSKARGKAGYYYDGDKEEKTMPKENPMKNSEGYSDPTAGKAMLNIEKEDYDINKYAQKVGDIWKLERTPYSTRERFSLVLAVCPGCASTIDVIPMDDFFDEKYCVIIDADHLPKDIKYYVDTRKVMQRSYKQFDRARSFVTDDQLDYIRGMIGSYLKISQGVKIIKQIVEVPVEKVVEKIVEVPAPTNGVYLSETEYALLKQRADIYEKAFYAATCGGTVVDDD